MYLILIMTTSMIVNIAASAALPASLISRDITKFMDAESMQNLAAADDGIEAMYEIIYGWYWDLFTETCDKVFHKNCSSVEYNELIAFFNLDMNFDVMKFFKIKLTANPGYVFKLLSGPIKDGMLSFPNLSLLTALLGINPHLSTSNNLREHFYKLLLSIGIEQHQSTKVTNIIGKLFALQQIDKNCYNRSQLIEIREHDILNLIKRWGNSERLFAFEQGLFEILFDLNFILNADVPMGHVGGILNLMFMIEWDKKDVIESERFIEPSSAWKRKTRKNQWRDMIWNLVEEMLIKYPQYVDYETNTNNIAELLKHVAKTLGFDMSCMEWDIGELHSRLESKLPVL